MQETKYEIGIREENELRGAGKNDNSQPKAKQIRKVPSGRQPRGYITGACYDFYFFPRVL